MSEVRFCTTGRPQLFEFEVATCRACKLRSKKAILKDAKMTLPCAKIRSLNADLTPPNVYCIHKATKNLNYKAEALAHSKKVVKCVVF